jgi:hypothetical protein
MELDTQFIPVLFDGFVELVEIVFHAHGYLPW